MTRVVVDDYKLGDRDREDDRVWVPDVENGFSVKSFYSELSTPAPMSVLLG